MQKFDQSLSFWANVVTGPQLQRSGERKRNTQKEMDRQRLWCTDADRFVKAAAVWELCRRTTWIYSSRWAMICLRCYKALTQINNEILESKNIMRQKRANSQCHFCGWLYKHLHNLVKGDVNVTSRLSKITHVNGGNWIICQLIRPANFS